MKYSRHYLAIAVLLALLAGVSTFTIFNSGKSDSSEQEAQAQKSRNLANLSLGEDSAKQANSADLIAARLAKANSREEFLRILKESLYADEANTIKALATLDSIYLEESYPITELFKEYFSERYTALDSITRLSPLKDKWFNIYKMAAIDLLAWHGDKDDPLALVDFLNNPENSEIANVVPSSVAYHIARQDISQALDLIDVIQDQDMQERFREGVFQEWVTEDPVKVAEHLLSQERGPQYDSAVYTLASSLDHRYHDVAMVWVDEIHDPTLRRETYEKVADSWYNIPDEESRNDYAKWKAEITDQDLLQRLEEQENEHDARREIKQLFQESVSEISNILTANVETGASLDPLEGALDGLVSLSQDVIQQAKENPDDSLLQEEAFIIKKRIAEDFPRLGQLHPVFQEIITSYKDTYTSAAPEADAK